MQDWDLPELASDGTGKGIIRIPCERDVPFTPRVRALVDTPEFQRLHHISQLGLVRAVYPGANHTRFEHALGVYDNAVRYLTRLVGDVRFRELCTPRDGELLLVAALLHDLGHWPYCHPIEDLGLAALPHHEESAGRFLLGQTDLNRVLREVWQIDPADVLDLLAPRTHSPRMKMLRSILSGPIDIDKMDYLDRDSLHAGVPYGRNFDRNRLISSLTLNEAGDSLAIDSKGKTAAELMVFARYVMFSEVYWHHAVRSATTMFARAFYHLHQQIDLDAFFRGRESDSIENLRQQARGTASEQLLEGIFGSHRAIYKRVGEFSAVDHPEIYQQFAHQKYDNLVLLNQRLIASLKQVGFRIDSDDLLIDAPPPKREVQFKIDVYFAKEKRFRPLASVSPVVEALAHRQFDDFVKKVRFFAKPELAGQISLEELMAGIERM